MRTITPSAEERWLASSLPVRRVSATMALVAFGSLALHGILVGATGVAAHSSPPPPQEISVEIVQEAPKRPEPAKVAAAAPEPAKATPEPIKATPEPIKAEPSQPEPAKPEPVRHDLAKPAPPAREADAEQKLAQLQDELQRLKQEQAQLQAERTAETPTPQPAALHDTGLGALPDTFQSIALPATTEGQGEAASYQAIVFSALAKAKGIGGVMGLPGSAGVQFSVDATGKLVQVELVHRSGVPSLDAQALDIVRRAAPFPPPPQGAQRNFAANFNFETQTTR